MSAIITSLPAEGISVSCGEHVSIAGIFDTGWNGIRSLSLNVDENGSADIFFLFLGTGEHAFPLDFLSVQHGRHSRVRCFFRSVLFGASAVSGSAVLRLTRESNGSDAYFSHHILLLSDAARGTATPSLEIETSGATARHAASVSPLDTESQFYLEARGCAILTAQKMLVRGFLIADIAMADSKEMRADAEHKIDSFLESQFSL